MFIILYCIQNIIKGFITLYINFLQLGYLANQMGEFFPILSGKRTLGFGPRKNILSGEIFSPIPYPIPIPIPIPMTYPSFK